MVKKIKPEQVTLVPDAPDALTSNAGWNIKKHLIMLSEMVKELQQSGITSSLFIDADETQVELVAKTGTNRIEFYTEDYAKSFTKSPAIAIAPYVHCAKIARNIGLEINAGHDLNLQNLAYLNNEIPFLHEVSIGHALISDALLFGMQNTIMMYKKQLNQKGKE